MLTSDEERMWRASLANCAIEGNKFAIDLLRLRDVDPVRYLQELEEFVL